MSVSYSYNNPVTLSESVRNHFSNVKLSRTPLQLLQQGKSERTETDYLDDRLSSESVDYFWLLFWGKDSEVKVVRKNSAKLHDNETLGFY